MIAIIEPGMLSGVIQPPPSKSISQRAIALSLLREGKTILHNAGNSDDEEAALKVVQMLGAEVSRAPNGTLTILSAGITPVSEEINFNESGLSARMFTPVCCLSSKSLLLTANGSLLNRPMNLYEDILPALNVKFKSNHGHFPIAVNGPLVPKDISIDGSQSSQYSTGLCLAYTFACSEKTSIQIKNPVSTPYLRMTLQMMREFGFDNWTAEGDTEIIFYPKDEQHYDVFSYHIESDWSNAAFLIAAVLQSPGLQLIGINPNSMQGDAVISTIIDDVKNGAKNINYNATNTPDLFPPLAYLAAFCTESSRVQGIHRLAHKESDRLRSITEILSSFGVKSAIENDSLIIYPAVKITAAHVHAHHDHRIAMLAALFALQADGTSIIDNAEAVHKSFPAFWDTLISAGAKIRLED